MITKTIVHSVDTNSESVDGLRSTLDDALDIAIRAAKLDGHRVQSVQVLSANVPYVQEGSDNMGEFRYDRVDRGFLIILGVEGPC